VRRALASIGAGVMLDRIDLGWPSIVSVNGMGQSRRVSLYLAQVSPMSRRSHEVRFQNPGQKRPILASDLSLPILAGFTEVDGNAMLVCAEATRRIGLMSRFSVLFTTDLLAEAKLRGWAERINENGERYFAFRANLFPLYVEMLAQNAFVNAEVLGSTLLQVQDEAEPTEQDLQRERRAASVLIRRERFRHEVLSAYSERCAMCGINLGLVVGAHIFPVSAIGSSDEVSNGIALCENHHRAFDAHRIWVNPDNGEVRLDEYLRQRSQEESVARRFIESTLSVLRRPVKIADYPSASMFSKRYAYYEGRYAWA
jgi:hypothetical protein